MKMKSIIYLVLFFTSIILISSCSENTSTNDNPSIISLSKTVVVIGESITITGMKFGTTRNSSYVSVNGTQATDYTSWSDTSIVLKIPVGATSGNVIVNVSGKQSNAVAITILLNYFPNAVGNYWIYESFKLDTNGNRENATRVIDSVTITGTKLFLERTSDIYSTYTGSNQPEDNYYISENGKLYTNITNIMPTEIPFPIDYTDAWIVIANPDSANWSIFEKSFDNVDVTLQGFSGKLNGTLTIKGEKGRNEYMTTGENNLSVMAQEYKILYSFTGTFTPTLIPQPITLNFTVTSHRWYSDNIGLIFDRVDPETITLPMYIYPIPGRESGMLRFHINQ